MKERQHSIIEGDIRFSHEELVKVISITDYLVAKLRARAITRRTDWCTAPRYRLMLTELSLAPGVSRNKQRRGNWSLKHH